MSKNPLPTPRNASIAPLDGPLDKRSWGEVCSDMVTGPRFGYGMNEDDHKKAVQRFDDVIQMEQVVNPSDTTSTYLFSKYDDGGDLLDTGDQCGQIARFFFAKRPPTQAGTPWDIRDFKTYWAVQLKIDSPQLNKDEQAELLKDLGGSCSRVLQVDWTQTGIKWGGGPAWLSKEDVEKEKGDGKGKGKRKAPA